MKKFKKQNPPKPKELVASYDSAGRVWRVEIGTGYFRIFVTQKEAEDFCNRKKRKRVKSVGYNQELPQNSVWTGAPWDRSFEHLR